MENFDRHLLPFFENDLFIKWVTEPDEAGNAHWEKWMKEHPDQADDLLQAKKIALDIEASEKPANTEQLSTDIWNKINARIEADATVIPLVPSTRKFYFYRIAASFAGALILASMLYYFTSRHTQRPVPQAVAGIIKNDTLHRVNSTVQNQVVYLVDGTKVTLQPGSSIRHTVFLEKDKREVYLDGNAFFEVAKDPNRPFYVYTHAIVLRVLGTSFNVLTNKDNGNITVVVRTGKVSVYKNNNSGKAEFILTPNQRILYTAQTQSIVKSELAGTAVQPDIKPEAHPLNFNFEEMPVAKIFATLEEGYGIKIRYDEAVFSKCVVTTSLNDESFEEKLKIICAAVNADYRIENNEVMIKGNGCK